MYVSGYAVGSAVAAKGSRDMCLMLFQVVTVSHHFVNSVDGGEEYPNILLNKEDA